MFKKGYDCRNKEVLTVIEKHISEYLSAIREYGTTPEQKEYYKSRLDALYALNRELF